MECYATPIGGGGYFFAAYYAPNFNLLHCRLQAGACEGGNKLCNLACNVALFLKCNEKVLRLILLNCAVSI